MDEIYQGARVVLIDNVGRDANAGLGGVSLSRSSQSTVQVGTYLMVKTHEPPSYMISTSPSASPGWTYQESALATRRLFIMENWVYFECNEANRTDIICNHLDNRLTRVRSPRMMRNFAENSEEICHHIRVYTQRALTYSSDSLSAILGIFNSLSTSPGVIHHYWGVPILCSNNMDKEYASQENGVVLRSISALSGLLRGLCWRPSQSHNDQALRRLDFPSWSWSGWDHSPFGVAYPCFGDSVHYPSIKDMHITHDDITCDWDSFWSAMIMSSNSGTFPSPPSQHVATDTLCSATSTPRLHIKGYVANFIATIGFEVQNWDSQDPDLSYPLSENSTTKDRALYTTSAKVDCSTSSSKDKEKYSAIYIGYTLRNFDNLPSLLAEFHYFLLLRPVQNIDISHSKNSKEFSIWDTDWLFRAQETTTTIC